MADQAKPDPKTRPDPEPPAERIAHDAGLSPAAVQTGAIAGAAIGGRRGDDAGADDVES